MGRAPQTQTYESLSHLGTTIIDSTSINGGVLCGSAPAPEDNAGRADELESFPAFPEDEDEAQPSSWGCRSRRGADDRCSSSCVPHGTDYVKAEYRAFPNDPAQRVLSRHDGSENDLPIDRSGVGVLPRPK